MRSSQFLLANAFIAVCWMGCVGQYAILQVQGEHGPSIESVAGVLPTSHRTLYNIPHHHAQFRKAKLAALDSHSRSSSKNRLIASNKSNPLDITSFHKEYKRSGAIKLNPNQTAVDAATPSQDRILVMYSGPTDYVPFEPFDKAGLRRKQYLYQHNFEYFLKRIDCNRHDTAIVLTNKSKIAYASQLQRMDAQCQKTGHRIFLLTREFKCYDMESLRLILSSIETNNYDKFAYMNCGTAGPHQDYETHWLDIMFAHLSETVKMTGLSINCHCFGKTVPHIQSMVFATDRTGLDVIRDIPFDCEADPVYTNLTDSKARMIHIVKNYECKMGRSLLNAGFGLQSMLQTQPVHAVEQCKHYDFWTPETMRRAFKEYPTFQELMFFKSSRFATRDVMSELHFSRLEIWGMSLWKFQWTYELQHLWNGV